MSERNRKLALCCILLLFISAICAVTVSAEGTDQHRHVWIMAEEESPIHDTENGGHRQVRECAVTINGERCAETVVVYKMNDGYLIVD